MSDFKISHHLNDFLKGELDGGRPKSALGGGGVRSFNLLRLREIAQQRNETARTFDGGGGGGADKKSGNNGEDTDEDGAGNLSDDDKNLR